MSRNFHLDSQLILNIYRQFDLFTMCRYYRTINESLQNVHETNVDETFRILYVLLVYMYLEFKWPTSGAYSSEKISLHLFANFSEKVWKFSWKCPYFWTRCEFFREFFSINLDICQNISVTFKDFHKIFYNIFIGFQNFSEIFRHFQCDTWKKIYNIIFKI